MLKSVEKAEVIRLLLETSTGTTSVLRHYISTDGPDMPLRFAEKPGFICSEHLKYELAEVFTDSTKGQSLPDGQWVKFLKNQIISEVEQNILTDSSKEKIAKTVALGKARIMELFLNFRKNIIAAAESFKDGTPSEEIHNKVEEIIAASFPKPEFKAENNGAGESKSDNSSASMAIQHIQDLYAHLNDHEHTKDLMKSHVGIEAKAMVSTISDILSAVNETSHFVTLLAETAKAMTQQTPNQKTDVVFVSMAKSLYESCQRFAKELHTKEAAHHLVSILRGYKNATKPLRKKLFTNPSGCKKVSDALKGVLEAHSPVSYKGIKETKPDLKPLIKAKSLRNLNSPGSLAA